jgi:large subunit ribosomal protein L17
MHRNGYKGRKFGREKDQRRALIKGLAESLIVYESIETTLHKAKELIPYTEKLVTKAKKGDLANRRMIISSLNTVESAAKLIEEIAPKLKSRNSGYLRIVKSSARRGDQAQLAKVSFIYDEKSAKPVAPTPKPASKPSVSTKEKAEVKK